MFTVWLDEKVYDKDKVWRGVKARKASHRCDVRIGKKGVSKEVLEEIENRLKREGVVKVRILKSALEATGLDRRGLARTVAEKLHAELVEVRGRTFILVKGFDRRKR